MALSKRYFTVQGEIIGEKASGSSRIDYLTDALGSVTATVDQNAQIVNTYRYKPYGEQFAKTGAGSDPKYLFTGNIGVRRQQNKFSNLYIRARHISAELGVFTGTDPDRAYRYPNGYIWVKQNPTSFVDRTGMRVENTQSCVGENWGGQGSFRDCFIKLREALEKVRGTPNEQQIINKCFVGFGKTMGKEYLDRVYELLNPKSSKTACLFCRRSDTQWDFQDRECAEYFENLCFQYIWGIAAATPPLDYQLVRGAFGAILCVPGRDFAKSKRCHETTTLNGKKCDCIIVSCAHSNPNMSPGCCYQVPIHELLHCASGYPHDKSGKTNPIDDWLFRAAACLCQELFGKSASDCECEGVS